MQLTEENLRRHTLAREYDTELDRLRISSAIEERGSKCLDRAYEDHLYLSKQQNDLASQNSLPTITSFQASFFASHQPGAEHQKSLHDQTTPTPRLIDDYSYSDVLDNHRTSPQHGHDRKTHAIKSKKINKRTNIPKSAELRLLQSFHSPTIKSKRLTLNPVSQKPHLGLFNKGKSSSNGKKSRGLVFSENEFLCKKAEKTPINSGFFPAKSIHKDKGSIVSEETESLSRTIQQETISRFFCSGNYENKSSDQAKSPIQTSYQKMNNAPNAPHLSYDSSVKASQKSKSLPNGSKEKDPIFSKGNQYQTTEGSECASKVETRPETSDHPFKKGTVSTNDLESLLQEYLSLPIPEPPHYAYDTYSHPSTSILDSTKMASSQTWNPWSIHTNAHRQYYPTYSRDEMGEYEGHNDEDWRSLQMSQCNIQEILTDITDITTPLSSPLGRLSQTHEDTISNSTLDGQLDTSTIQSQDKDKADMQAEYNLLPHSLNTVELKNLWKKRILY
ncbi:hypothetical protein BDF14DRAFT_1881028 [Spinellus fusiger]|nr:hypothetical protein BDF14DRAFT_1881028 [Spinellus fusiger]